MYFKLIIHMQTLNEDGTANKIKYYGRIVDGLREKGRPRKSYLDGADEIL